MLEKDYQLSAYKKLAAAGGMKTPGAITSARNSANTAKLLAEELTGLILDTIVYPDTITSYVSTIRTTTTGLTNIGELATKHADLLAGYADLSMLLQLDIGWDVYCRANEREVSELPISIAIGDVTITKSLEDAVNALNTSSRQPGGCGLSWPEITVIKTDNIIVFQVVICPVQLNPVNENLPLKEANFPAMS